MDEYEGVIIGRCVKARYDFLDSAERDRIISITKKLAKEYEGELFPSYEKRRERVKKALEEYFKANDKIVPGGFVDFRHRELYYSAEVMASEGAKRYFDEKEYEEFTHLLSAFISQKEAKEEVLHLVWSGGRVRLLNKRRRDVTEKYEKEFYSAAYKKGLGQEDLAISAVISAAPERLVFHCPPAFSPLKETLEKIFEGKCKTCQGCNICKKA